MKIDTTKFKELIEERYISVQKHPTEDLYIYNYTSKCQYNKYWTPETLMCRGLILDGEDNIVARPFRKFFNLEEHKEPLPDEEFTITMKFDGSLGIMYWIGDIPYIATRGSFTSNQALEGTKMLRSKTNFVRYLQENRKSYTYLFEIIYPENRIVVNYGDERKLVHIATIDNDNGSDVYEILPIETPYRHYAKGDLQFLLNKQEDNAEGYVIQYASGLRLKIKFKEYVRLHKLVTGLNTRAIWEAVAIDSLRSKGMTDAKVIGLKLNLDKYYVEDILECKESLITRLVDRVPDELYKWVTDVSEHYKEKFRTIRQQVLSIYMGEQLDQLPRKEAALKIMTHPKKLNTILFAMLSEKEYDSIIWQIICPKHSKAYKVEI